MHIPREEAKSDDSMSGEEEVESLKSMEASEVIMTQSFNLPSQCVMPRQNTESINCQDFKELALVEDELERLFHHDMAMEI